MTTIVSNERVNQVDLLNQPASEKIMLPTTMPRNRGSSCLVSPMVFTSCDQYANRKSKAVEKMEPGTARLAKPQANFLPINVSLRLPYPA